MRPTRLRPFLALLLLASTGAAHAQSSKARPTVHQPALKSESPQTRSAQGDCVREANRRGFTVLDTRNFQQNRDGWSLDMRVRDMRGRVTDGSCFVETRTGDANLYGFGWGYDDPGDDSMEFSCSSVESRRRECQVPVNGRARLIKQKSDSPCIEGQTWGQRGDRVWVDHGCRARFEVRRSGWDGGNGGDGNAGNAAMAALEACMREAQRRGYRIEKMGTANQGAGVYRIPMKLREPTGNGMRSGTCSYYTGSREARIEF